MAGRPVPGQFNNGLVARSMPKMGDELVVVPLFWKVKEKRFAFATDFPYQLKGIISPQEYALAINNINKSIETPKQRRLNILCFFCFGCCNICCKPDMILAAKEMVFEPRGLSLRGPRMKMVPLNSGFSRPDGPKQKVTWLEICPSVNGKPAYPMGSVHRKQEKKKAKREKKRQAQLAAQNPDTNTASPSAVSGGESKQHPHPPNDTKNGSRGTTLPGALAGGSSVEDSDEESDDDSIPDIVPIIPANAPTAGAKVLPADKQRTRPEIVPAILLHEADEDLDVIPRVRKPKPKPRAMTEADRRQALLDAMPLSEEAKQAIRRRREGRDSPRSAKPVEVRPHPMSHKLVGGQGIEDQKYIEEQRVKEAKEAEDRQRRARQQARKAQKAAREQRIKMAAAAAAAAAADAISMGQDPFMSPSFRQPGFGMPVAAPMVVPGAPYVPVAAAAAPGYFPPAMGAAPAGAAYSGPSMYSVASASAMSNRMVSTRSSHALQHAGSSFMGRPQAVQPPPPVTRSVPGSTQKTPRGASSARRPRTNSTGSFYGNGHSSRWQGARQAAATEAQLSPTANNLKQVASELHRLRFNTAGDSPVSSERTSPFQPMTTPQRGGGVSATRTPGVPGLRGFQSNGSMRGSGELR